MVDMTNETSKKCEYSRLLIPNQAAYARIAGKYAGEVAKEMGFDEVTSDRIGESLSGAITISFGHSFEPSEDSQIEITFERTIEGLEISIYDKGLPWSPGEINDELSCELVDSDSDKDERFSCLNDFMDKFEFRNLGSRGKETVLIKKLPYGEIANQFSSCHRDADPDEHQYVGNRQSKTVTIRRMKEEEAIEVARAIYRTYGYSYGYEQVYLPNKLAELNRNDDIVTAVAVEDSGTVVGTLSIMRWGEYSEVAEIGQGVVIPSYRNSGVFSRLNDFQKEQAQAMGLKGFFVLAVTNHTFSQKTASRFNGRDCAIMLNYIPASVDFKALDKTYRGRVSVMVLYHDIETVASHEIFPPIKHKSFIMEIYGNLGLNAVDVSETERMGEIVNQELHSHVKVIPPLKYARITVERFGKDFMSYFKKTVRELLLNDIEIINLLLNLSDPDAKTVTPHLEECGFFFSGVLPKAVMGNDALILQYLKGEPVIYDEIMVASEFGKKIVDYVRLNDPNWQ